jgi:methionine sulfoxide reductase heme-binding subunit
MTRGWALVGWTAAGLAVMCLALGEPAAIIRATARVAFLLFVVTFLASSVFRLFRVRWPLTNRRYLGLSFALAHVTHLAFLAVTAPARLTPSPFVFAGALAYLLLAAMIVTSFDRTKRWLRPRQWKLLHRTGMIVLFAVFTVTYAGRWRDPFYVPFLALALLALGVRLAAWRKGR